MRLVVAATVLAATAWTSTGWAHAYLVSSEPSGGATVDVAPDRVVLRTSEPVEVRFSRFAVVRLDEPPTDVAALREAAQELADAVLADGALADAEGWERADDGVATTDARSDEIVLELRTDLSPGTYVAMWRVLSVDGHVSDDVVWFHVAPAGAP